MQLQEFFDYKNQLVNDLLTHESIVSLINEEIPMSEAPSLLYRQVFPYEYIPEVITEGKTFICCEVDVQGIQSKTFLYPTLYIWVFAHSSVLRLAGGKGVRTDKLCSEICKVINGSRYYGLGELDLYSVKRFAPMSNFSGKQMVFSAKDFNRTYDGLKPAPANRRLG